MVRTRHISAPVANSFANRWLYGKAAEHIVTTGEGLRHELNALDDAALMQQLGRPGVAPEGRFFPDTYRYVGGMSDEDLLKQANARLEAVLAEEWQQRAEGLP